LALLVSDGDQDALREYDKIAKQAAELVRAIEVERLADGERQRLAREDEARLSRERQDALASERDTAAQEFRKALDSWRFKTLVAFEDETQDLFELEARAEQTAYAAGKKRVPRRSRTLPQLALRSLYRGGFHLADIGKWTASARFARNHRTVAA
jgi:hypothetical protein